MGARRKAGMNMHGWLAALGLAFSGSVDGQEIQAVDYPVRLEIAADGSVTGMNSFDHVPDGLRKIVEAASARARFEPARADGRAVPSATWVTARVKFTPSGDHVRAYVGQVVHAGGLIREAPPRGKFIKTPSAALSKGYGALASVRAVFSPDGSIDMEASGVETVVLRRAAGKPVNERLAGSIERDIRTAIIKGMPDWTRTPDTVGGRPIGATLWIPVDISLRQEWGKAGGPDLPIPRYEPINTPELIAPRFASWTSSATSIAPKDGDP